MTMKKRTGKILCFVLLAGMLLSVSACGSKEKGQDAAEQSVSAQSADKQAVNETVSGTSAAAEQASSQQNAEGQAADTAAAADQTNTTQISEGQAEGGQEAGETGAVKTETAADLPRVTENPTDESLTEGYSCMYIASAENADKIEWRAVSPDGKTDIAYSEISEYFPYLEYMGEDEEAISLYNIPADFDGWESYCRFTNASGSTDSRHAVTHVKALKDVEAEQAKQAEQTEQAGQAEEQPDQTEQEPLQAEQAG